MHDMRKHGTLAVDCANHRAKNFRRRHTAISALCGGNLLKISTADIELIVWDSRQLTNLAQYLVEVLVEIHFMSCEFGSDGLTCVASEGSWFFRAMIIVGICQCRNTCCSLIL